MTSDDSAVVHSVYLPYTTEVLRQHFAKVRGGGDPERHLAYYRASAQAAREFRAAPPAGDAGTQRRAIARGRQLEKDERFWIVTALLSVFYEPDCIDALSRLLSKSLGARPPFEGCATWAEALAGPLHLYFEVNLPSPETYRVDLAKRLDDRVIVPYLREAAKRSGTQLEGSTKVDALLLAPDTGFATIFEGKVLSDVSGGVQFDAVRNQIARNIDVMLEQNDRVDEVLTKRDPARSCFVLITPAIFQRERGSRLYGWLLPGYQNDVELLQSHLPHRDRDLLATVGQRLGWISWEDINEVRPRACSWLVKEPGTADGAPLVSVPAHNDRGTPA